MDDWKARGLGRDTEVKRETVEYQGRTIQMERAGLWKLATAWAGPWFFFANDIENLKTLLDRGLVRIIGKKEEVGRPMLYGTTPEFLRVFNLRVQLPGR